MAEGEDENLKDGRSYRAEPDPRLKDEGGGGGSGGGDDKKEGEKKKGGPIWPWIAAAVVVVGFAVLVLWIIFAPHRRQRTSDAYVTAHFATVAPRVAGQVAAVPVADNQRVRAGDLLLALDPRDFQASLEQARATLASDTARVAEAQAQVLRQPALIRQAQAQVSAAQARLHLARADSSRFADLASTGAGTVQQHQQADATLEEDRASLVQAQAELTAQQRQLDALEATASAAQGRTLVDRAQVDQAQLNLSYTRLVAPIDGVVDQRQVQVGNIVSPGAAVMTVVPLDGVYVLANYRELSLRHMRPGQPVRVHIDAYDVDLAGVVDSLPPASGSSYSPIPAVNASGNFTKIVQRLPVKIVFRPNQRLTRLVRVGMSAETTVDTGLEDVVAEQRREDLRVTGGGR